MTLAAPGVFERARPPTPPRDHTADIDEALDFLNVEHSLDKPSSAYTCGVPGIETPPKSSPTSTSNQSLRHSKKVGFKSYTLQHEGPSPKKDTAALRPLPQTREAKPLRSILKSNILSTPTPEECSSPLPGYFSPREPVSIPKMLASVVQALGSQDVLSRLDGYMTLNNALKAHDDFPAVSDLREQVPRIAQYVLRDLRGEANSPQSKNINTQALNLTNVLFTIPGLAAEVPGDVRNALLDLALQAMAQDPANKATTNRFLYLLATTEFKARGLTQQKADLLITQLEDIHVRISGNSVVAARLAVYQRLMLQIPTTMLHRLPNWIDHVFHGCLSSNEDICKRAIQCGMDAGLILGTHLSATKCIMDLFSVKIEGGGSFGDYFTARLTDMAGNKKQSVYVPQIWSVIIMFFRNKKSHLSHWRLCKSLLLVVQRCLNSGDQQIKFQALIAWNRLAFVTALDTVTIEPPDQLIRMLNVPFAAALGQKSGTDKAGSGSRKTALAGYANLLYYALQPTQSFDRIDLFWGEYVQEMIPRMLKLGGTEGRFANRILRSLFSGVARAWSPDRALAAAPVEPDELSRLDPQWLRSRLSTVLTTLEAHFGATLCVPHGRGEQYEPWWNSLMAGVAAASAQEIRTSMETREALAHLMNFFARVWAMAQRWLKGEAPQGFISRFGDMLLTAMHAFGPVTFLEENLAIGTSHKAEPAPTPSNRTSKHHHLQSPFLFLWRLIATPHAALDDVGAIGSLAQALTDAVFANNAPLMTQMILLRSCMQVLEQSQASNSLNPLEASLANILLSSSSSAINSGDSTGDAQIRHSHLAKVSLALIRSGLSVIGTDKLSTAWSITFDAISRHLSNASGGAGVNFGILEPLATSLLHDVASTPQSRLIELSTLLLSRWTWVSSRQQLERSWKLLEGISLDPSRRQTLLDKKPDVLGLANVACGHLTESNELEPSSATAFLQSLRLCLENCPSHLLLPSLLQLVHMKDLIRDSHAASRDAASVRKLWQSTLSSLRALQLDNESLVQLESLLDAGFTSRHRSIVNETIIFWNATYGQQMGVEYPAGLAAVLIEVSKYVDIDLPNISSSSLLGNDLAIDLPAFAEGVISSQEEFEEFEDHLDSPRKMVLNDTSVASLHRRTPSRTKLPAPPNRTPQSAVMPPPRLRHDNSQIEFVNVENLPSELTEDGTQGLTDHQKEVRERQQDEAHRVFPQFSSSPVPPSASKDIIRDRIAHVTQQRAMGARLRTPEIEVDEQGPMDAFLGSSPSQRSAQRAQTRSSQLNVEPVKFVPNATEDVLGDIPSSPPELAEEYETAHNDEVAFSDVALRTEGQQDPRAEAIDARNVDPVLEANETDDNDFANNKPELKDKLASSQSPMMVASNQDEGEASYLPSSPILHDQALQDVIKANLIQSVSNPAGSTAQETGDEVQIEVDATRIEDSFIGASDAGTTLVEPQNNGQTQMKMQEPANTPPRTRKRRISEPQSSSPGKRLKKESPIKKLFTWLGGQKDGVSDESDMEDCIVVASQPEPKTPIIEMGPVRPASQPSTASQPARRGRGRPRKTPLSAQSPVAQSPGSQRASGSKLKRKASALSQTSMPEEEDNSNTTSVTSSPRKTRRQTKAQDATSTPAVTTPTDDVAVLVSPRPTKEFEQGSNISGAVQATPDQHDEGDGDHITPERQLREEAAAAARANERVILSPKSIIGRLKDILVDVKEMGKKFVLGSQEERELNGMLFELGGEVHAAGKRQ
ncbi:hypothetical protein CAC42_1595 [Sphaceloma murrayae]|uniref:Telomere-associated protein Rif1 N-terminal domain-containing protein n=1 Tax=Sphaceloma murrayae TaxID=2082308 RepID=A0A2K1R375_9PEZI|nr:hypothetical protein CAC42_1595 [Sphaceloma murrayae]